MSHSVSSSAPATVDLVPVRRALISVSDKTGLVEFATALHRDFGVALISTGGTAKSLRDAGLPVTDVSQVTGFPEMMDGRVKTLHPAIHGALLALRDDPQHVAAMKAHGIEPIDLVCINLYPFAKTVARPDATFAEAIENIDIGGPSMIRSAAKNHRFVLVVTSPDAYPKVLGDLKKHEGSSCAQHRLKQAQRAFAHTAAYDGAIAEYLSGKIEAPTTAAEPEEGSHPDLPAALDLHLVKRATLRYGENPHQAAALYVDCGDSRGGERDSGEASVAFAKQHHGKALSYINLLDADAALSAVKEVNEPAACIVKHATPCGFAVAADLPAAFASAFGGDPLAAFGGIVAMNQRVDLPTAQAIVSIDKLLEVIVAPGYSADALELLKTRWKNVRLLEVGTLSTPAAEPGQLHLHRIVGGYLAQQRDLAGWNPEKLKVVTQRPPTPAEMADLRIAWLICKHVKSNAIALAKTGMLVGSGAGQQDRLNACRIAVAKAGARAAGSVAASDAFFPFPDGPELLLNAGVTAIIHPGGSLGDQKSIDLANARGAALVITGERHFKH